MDIYINEKIEINLESVNKKFSIAKENLKVGEILVDIPPKGMLNLEKIYKLSTKKEKAIYDQISKEQKFQSLPPLQDTLFGQGSENTIITLAVYSSILKEKGKIYKKFKEYFETFEDNLDNSPIFYPLEEKALLQNLTVGANVEAFEALMEAEILYLNSILSESIIQDDYQRLKLLLKTKAYKIQEKETLVPLTEFFEQNPSQYSCEIEISQEGNLKIKVKKPIIKGERIYLKSKEWSNILFLFTLGKTYENNNLLEVFPMPVASFYWLNSKNITKNIFGDIIPIINLLEDGFVEKLIPYYLDIAKYLGMKDGKKDAYKLMLQNFEMLLKDLKNVNYNEFYSQTNKINIKRIVELDISLISLKKQEIENALNQSIQVKEDL